MNTKTAGTLVTITAAVLIAGAVLTTNKQSSTQRYRAYWGIGLFWLGGTALADLAPDVVAPYMLLVLIAYLGSSGTLGKLIKTGKTATVTPSK